jgi:hypothetical protein
LAAVLRPYPTAGAALAGAGLAVASQVMPVTPQPPHSAAPGVALMSGDGGFDLGDLLNVPANLFNDIANIPYELFSAPYSVKGLIPNFTTGDEHVPGSGIGDDGATPGSGTDPDDPASVWPNYAGPFDGGPDDDTFHGALNFLSGSLDYTNSWLESFPTQVWGWDTGNPWNGSALLDVLFPFQYLGESAADNPVSDNVNKLFEAESPPADPGNVIYFHDPRGELDEQFSVPMSKLTGDDGYYLDPEDNLNNVGHDADPLGQGGETYHEIWSGTQDHVDADYGLGQIAASLTQDPADNPIRLPDLDDIYPTLVHSYHSLNVDFNILAPGTDSFVFQSAKDLFGIPFIINGSVNAEHGTDPGAPDVLPGDVWHPLGDALDKLIGPDTAFAQTVSDLAGRSRDLTEGLADIFLPQSDAQYQSPDQVLSEVFSPGYVNASGTDIQGALDDYAAENGGIDFGSADTFSEGDIATALVAGAPTDILGGDISPAEVARALANDGVSISGGDFDAGDIADALNGGAVGDNTIGDLIGGVF